MQPQGRSAPGGVRIRKKRKLCPRSSAPGPERPFESIMRSAWIEKASWLTPTCRRMHYARSGVVTERCFVGKRET